jgi:hypothetical protein
MTFKLQFETETADFDGHIQIAVAHTLKNTAQKIILGMTRGRILDHDGNPIGRWHLDHPEVESEVML